MEKKLFFALDIQCPWPEIHIAKNASDRILKEESRHLTLAFLGNVYLPNDSFQTIPIPKFFAPIGMFDHSLFLPQRNPRVAAWHVSWLSPKKPLFDYHQSLLQWITQQNITLDTRPFLPHVTIARAPSNITHWQQSFHPLPLYASSLHLYESQGHSSYLSLWHAPLLIPFEEIEHTADIAYKIYGYDLEELYLHAFAALCFNFPLLISYYKQASPQSIEEIVMCLNHIVTIADGDIGCPFKAVSFHGKLIKNDFFHWEMIIDV